MIIIIVTKKKSSLWPLKGTFLRENAHFDV